MQQIIKKFRPIYFVATILLAAVLFIGCNNEKTEEAPAETPAVENAAPAATDTMPAIDTSATSRPEPIKN